MNPGHLHNIIVAIGHSISDDLKVLTSNRLQLEDFTPAVGVMGHSADRAGAC
jgi:hypothetical protein